LLVFIRFSLALSQTHYFSALTLQKGQKFSSKI